MAQAVPAGILPASSSVGVGIGISSTKSIVHHDPSIATVDAGAPSAAATQTKARRQRLSSLVAFREHLARPTRRRLGRFMVSVRKAASTATSAALPEDERQHMREVAKRESLFHGIVWVKPMSAERVAELASQVERGDSRLVLEMEAADARRQRVELERFPVWPRRDENIYVFGCSVAVALYLRFLAEGALVFLLVFLLSTAALNDNVRRNDYRYACRHAARNRTGCGSLARGSPSPRARSPLSHMPLRRASLAAPMGLADGAHASGGRAQV